jgi:hypothetical protein
MPILESLAWQPVVKTSATERAIRQAVSLDAWHHGVPFGTARVQGARILCPDESQPDALGVGGG